MSPAERQQVIDALEYAAEKVFCENDDDLIAAALAIMRRETACKYPVCVDSGPDGKCTAWLIGDCEGPKHD